MYRPVHYAFKDEENVYVYKNHRLIHVSRDYSYDLMILPRQLHIHHLYPFVEIRDGEREYGYHGFDCVEINQKADEQEWVRVLSESCPFLCKDVWALIVNY
jgi:hypothetical protein